MLKNLPDQTGMAYVLVQHLDPHHESNLVGLLGRITRMPVREVSDGLRVEPDHVYVIPPNNNMGIENGASAASPPYGDAGATPSRRFLPAPLASDLNNRSIGVILSGTASDGTLGLKAIKAEGGITFAQDESAKYDGMPRSAVNAGCVDFVLSPENIAAELIRFGTHLAGNRPEALTTATSQSGPASLVEKLFLILKKSSGVDFTLYKRTTLQRRIQRRMVVNRLDRLKDYVDFAAKNPAEVESLFQDVLIHVTSFFRDPECFEALKKSAFPIILKNKPPKEPIRFWVPGCSTGEEVYSLAICLIEVLGEKLSQTPVKIFATDISETTIDRARAGRYPENIASDVSETRLRRFFVKEDGTYLISKAVRDLCVFARQDATRDPPFSNIDLISCRNVLIYLGPVLQEEGLADLPLCPSRPRVPLAWRRGDGRRTDRPVQSRRPSAKDLRAQTGSQPHALRFHRT